MSNMAVLEEISMKEHRILQLLAEDLPFKNDLEKNQRENDVEELATTMQRV